MDILNEIACLLARAFTSKPSDNSSSAVRIPLPRFKQEEKLKVTWPGKGPLQSIIFCLVFDLMLLDLCTL